MTDAPVVFVHGMFMTAACWENWIERFEAAGHPCATFEWPHRGAPVEELRANHPDAELGRLTLSRLVHDTAVRVREMPEPPVLVGHSMGGLIVQLVLNQGLGAAGVAIDSGPVKGLLALPASTLKTGFPVLKNPANNHRAVPLTPEEFHYAFTNTLNDEESLAVYERYAVPGPGRVLFQGAFANFNPRSPAAVDFKNSSRAPLLFIAGGDDHVAPASLNEANLKHYRKSDAITELKEFPGRSHYTLGQEGWEEVADYALDWALSHAARVAAA
jgi:pimeloyl-ACP methyl ester carboxylesterase